MIPRARWQQIQSLFEQMLDTGPGERGARLGEACGDDLELRSSVESMLKSDARLEDPLLHAIGEAAEIIRADRDGGHDGDDDRAEE